MFALFHVSFLFLYAFCFCITIKSHTPWYAVFCLCLKVNLAIYLFHNSIKIFALLNTKEYILKTVGNKTFFEPSYWPALILTSLNRIWGVIKTKYCLICTPGITFGHYCTIQFCERLVVSLHHPTLLYQFLNNSVYNTTVVFLRCISLHIFSCSYRSVCFFAQFLPHAAVLRAVGDCRWMEEPFDLTQAVFKTRAQTT